MTTLTCTDNFENRLAQPISSALEVALLDMPQGKARFLIAELEADRAEYVLSPDRSTFSVAWTGEVIATADVGDLFEQESQREMVQRATDPLTRALANRVAQLLSRSKTMRWLRFRTQLEDVDGLTVARVVTLSYSMALSSCVSQWTSCWHIRRAESDGER
jgi:hypothetical protein